MSPILVRPVREQLEHDRLIRFLLQKYKKKTSEVAVNIGDEQVAPVKIGQLTLYPDLVLTVGRKLAGVIEVESGESVNNLEAMAQWVHFSHSKVPFHLYVPVQSYETARRLCEANHANVTEIWTYRAALDGFDLVRMVANAQTGVTSAKPATERPARPVKTPSRPAGKAKTTRKAPAPSAGVRTARPVAKPSRKAAAPVKPARRVKAKAGVARRK